MAPSSTSLPQTAVQGKVTHIPNDSSPKKSLFSTRNAFEQRFGYHRAVRRGPFIFVSGTTALKDIEVPANSPAVTITNASEAEDSEDESKVLFPGNVKKQALISMERCIDAVKQLGGGREDVVRVRMFVSKFEDTMKVGEAFRECFATRKDGSLRGDEREGDGVGATATMIVTKNGFVDVDMLVEIEMDAVVLDGK